MRGQTGTKLHLNIHDLQCWKAQNIPTNEATDHREYTSEIKRKKDANNTTSSSFRVMGLPQIWIIAWHPSYTVDNFITDGVIASYDMVCVIFLARHSLSLVEELTWSLRTSSITISSPVTEKNMLKASSPFGHQAECRAPSRTTHRTNFQLR